MKMFFIRILVLVNLFGCVEIRDNFSINGNPAKIFDHGISHGIGESVLDSPLLKDSLNAQILIASRHGLKLQQLQRIFSQVENLDNRINSLLTSKILDQEQDRFYTSFPILIGEDQKQYFQLINETVDKVYPTFLPSVNETLSKIDQKGWKPWSYHIIWSLIFDSQFVWYEMVDRNLAPPLTTPIAWVIYPQADYKTGTNYYPDSELKDYWVAVSWSPDGSNTTGVLGGNWEIIYNSALSENYSLSSQNKTLLMQLGLMNDQHEITFPVIFSEDVFNNHLKSTAGTYLDLLLENTPIDDFGQFIGRDKKFSWAVVYHDICWEILKRLVNDGIISQPTALSARQTSSELSQMVGVCSVISVYQPFVNQIMKAFAD